MLYEIVPNNTLKPLVLASALALAMVSAPAFAGKANLSGLRNGETYTQFIVKYRTGSIERKDSSALTRSLNRAAEAVVVNANTPSAKSRGGTPQRRPVGLRHQRRMAIGADVVRSDRALDRVDAETLMRRIAADPNVEYVEIDRKKRASMTPNDPRYRDQWHYANTAVGANVSAAWDTTDGRGVVVAVVDTGSTAHADLNANYIGGYDFVRMGNGIVDPGDGDGPDPDPTDITGHLHGSHVAGTIAAVTNNGTGVAGVAYGARVVPVRVLGRDGWGNESDINDGIIWAAGGVVNGVPANPNPAEVINLSLGGRGACSNSEQEAINAAVALGATVVVAAGNDNLDTSGHSPANCNNVIAVAASDINGDRAFYSNYGATIDITAPGGEVCSPMNVEFLPLNQQVDWNRDCWNASRHPEQGILSTTRAGTYEYYMGTSMATPHVAGIIALMQAAAPVPMTPARIEQMIRDTARPIAANNCPGGCGAGLIDAAAAVNAAAGNGGAVPSQLLRNPGFESGQVNWNWTNTDNSIAIYNNPARARTGNFLGWLNGRGTSRRHTSTLSQSVSIPAGRASATLNFHLRIETDETARIAYDNLTVQVLNASGRVLRTCATYSNLNASPNYVQRTCDLRPYIGQTVTIKFTGTEDESLKTGFLIDDVSLDVR